MSYDRLETRLRAVEEDRSTSDALLRFDDGSSRAISLRDPLSILCDAMRLRSGQLGAPEGAEDNREPEPPAIQHSEAIGLLGRAAGMESHDPLLHLVFDTSKSVAENKNAATKSEKD